MFSSIVLGIVQGLTEFLPISSSGHLVLAQHLFHFNNLDPAFNVFVQGGTVLSVLVYFRKRLLKLDYTYLKELVVATLPAAILGLLLSDYVDTLFSSLTGAALGFVLTTIVVYLSRYQRNLFNSLNLKQALIIGFAQALAILPGLTRSGTTITSALLLGITPAIAFEFSFLLSIPTIAGATILGAREMVWTPTQTPLYFAGFFTAAIVGYFSLVLLAKLVKKGKFSLFAPYTSVLALLTLYLVLIR